MQNIENKTLSCFICRSKKSRRGPIYKNIEKALVPNSKKPLKAVLVHLGKFIKSKLKVPPDACVCQRCYRDLVQYDDFVLKLLEVQQRLTQMIEKSLNEGNIEVLVFSSNEEEDEGERNTNKESHDDVEKRDVAYDNEDDNEEIYLEDIDSMVNLESVDEEEILLPSAEVKLETDDDDDWEEEEEEEEFVFRKTNKKERRRYGTKDKGSTCTVCGITLKDDEYLDLHMNLHEGKTETECRYCDKRFSRKRNVIRHMQVHWDKKKFQCDKCGLCFKQQIILWNHKQHHEAEKQPPRCEICNMVFKTKRTYTHHMVTHRPDRPRYSCEHCGKTFTEKYTLKVHKRTHPEATETTADPTRLLDQQTTIEVVAASIQYNCIICDLQFTNMDVLNKHMEREHDVITKPLTITNFSQYEVNTHE